MIVACVARSIGVRSCALAALLRIEPSRSPDTHVSLVSVIRILHLIVLILIFTLIVFSVLGS